jgi:hypothetical protein
VLRNVKKVGKFLLEECAAECTAKVVEMISSLTEGARTFPPPSYCCGSGPGGLCVLGCLCAYV